MSPSPGGGAYRSPLDAEPHEQTSYWRQPARPGACFLELDDMNAAPAPVGRRGSHGKGTSAAGTRLAGASW
jgi:hypothetical protein